MAGRSYSQDEIDTAVEALSEPGRFRDAERIVADIAPQLQRVLAGALAEGGWFGDAHESEIARIGRLEDEAERLTALRTLLAEETRVGLMVGVAVGWALAEQLAGNDLESASGTESATDTQED